MNNSNEKNISVNFYYQWFRIILYRRDKVVGNWNTPYKRPYDRALYTLSFENLFSCRCVCVHRLGVQYGLRVPVPQLASVCPGGGSSCYCLSGWTHLHAREPPLPPGGAEPHLLTQNFILMKHVIYFFFLENCKSAFTLLSACLLFICSAERQAWWSMDDPETGPWHQLEGQGKARKSLHCECM